MVVLRWPLAVIISCAVILVWIVDLLAILIQTIGGKSQKRSIAQKKRGLIAVSHVAWSRKIWQRNHHTMSLLSRRWKVLYCCPVPAQDLARQPGHFLSIRHEKAGANLFSFICPVLPGDTLFPFVKYINRLILYSALRRYSGSMGINADILWFYYPQYNYILKFFKDSLVVFDIMDDYTALARSTWIILERERELLKQSDYTFTGTYALFFSRKKYTKNIEFVPCGVEFDHFHQAADASLPVADEMLRFRRPVIGYIGHVGKDRIDSEILEYLAQSHPEWSIILIGPIELHKKSISHFKNLYLLGPRNYEDLPKYLKSFDICIIPFLLNPLTRSINPTKLLEYLAAGKPVVSTAIPDVERFYGEIVKIGKDKVEFEREINNLLSSDSNDLVQRGITFAKEKSWEGMTEKFIDIIEKKMQDKQKERMDKVL